MAGVRSHETGQNKKVGDGATFCWLCGRKGLKSYSSICTQLVALWIEW